MAVSVARRLTRLPPYLFARIDAAKSAARAAGQDLVDLGVGDPDQPTPAFIVRAMIQALRDPANHHYALDQGMPRLRETIAQWYHRRFGVTLDPCREILPLIGSKEGLAHLPWAVLDTGDRALVPDPSYPPYRTSTILAGGQPVAIPLREDHAFLPDFSDLRRATTARTKLLYVNYPNNPTGATAPPDFFRDLVRFAGRHQILIAHDAAYSEIALDGGRPASFLQAPGAKEVGVEFHSFSKTFNMTGWRIGWVCGNAETVAALARVKSHVDSSLFQAIQLAGIAALKAPATILAPQLALYRRRRNVLVRGLRAHGWPVKPPKATFYVWARIPRGRRSSDVAEHLLSEHSVVVIPGNGFGPAGEGYLRLALTVPESRIQEAIRRIGRFQLWPSPTSALART